VHESELETILSGDIDGHQVVLNPRTELPRGMFDWTTKDTLIGDRGGWDCRHQFFGVSDSTVPEEVRKRIEEKNVSRKWENMSSDHYKRTHSTNEILDNVKSKDKLIKGIRPKNMKDLGQTDALGNIYLNKDQ